MNRLIEARPASWRIREIQAEEELLASPAGADVLALPSDDSDPYLAGFAVSRPAIEDALRLRYEVFNLELGEGLAASHLTGLDEDEFDAQMTHLVIMDRASGSIVGTYRLQTAARAARALGLYSRLEFDLAPLKGEFPRLIELGRVCIAPQHRSLTSLHTLFSGVAGFARLSRCPLMFGCCSVTSRDPDDGWRALRILRRRGYLHPELSLRAQPACSCGSPERELDPCLGEGLKIPKLFTTYMRLGAKVISEPAIDREFGTVDFLVLCDSLGARS